MAGGRRPVGPGRGVQAGRGDERCSTSACSPWCCRARARVGCAQGRWRPAPRRWCCRSSASSSRRVRAQLSPTRSSCTTSSTRPGARFAEGLAALGYGLATQAPSFALAWLLAAAALVRPGLEGRRVWLVLGGWFLASALGVAIGWQFRPHYFVQALPALAGLRRTRRWPPWFARCSNAGRVRVFRPRPGARRGARRTAYAGESRGASRLPRPRWLRRSLWGLNPFPEAEAIGRHIARTSAPDETVFVIGSEPEIFFHAERRSATRYIFFYPLTGGVSGSGTAPARGHGRGRERETALRRLGARADVPAGFGADRALDIRRVRTSAFRRICARTRGASGPQTARITIWLVGRELSPGWARLESLSTRRPGSQCIDARGDRALGGTSK